MLSVLRTLGDRYHAHVERRALLQFS
jgi:hypothetical protein